MADNALRVCAMIDKVKYPVPIFGYVFAQKVSCLFQSQDIGLSCDVGDKEMAVLMLNRGCLSLDNGPATI